MRFGNGGSESTVCDDGKLGCVFMERCLPYSRSPDADTFYDLYQFMKSLSTNRVLRLCTGREQSFLWRAFTQIELLVVIATGQTRPRVRLERRRSEEASRGLT